MDIKRELSCVSLRISKRTFYRFSESLSLNKIILVTKFYRIINSLKQSVVPTRMKLNYIYEKSV